MAGLLTEHKTVGSDAEIVFHYDDDAMLLTQVAVNNCSDRCLLFVISAPYEYLISVAPGCVYDDPLEAPIPYTREMVDCKGDGRLVEAIVGVEWRVSLEP